MLKAFLKYFWYNLVDGKLRGNLRKMFEKLCTIVEKYMWQCQRKGPTLSILENEIRAFEVKKVKFIENEILLKMASIVSQLS